MTQTLWAIGLTVLLLAGSTLPAEAAGGGAAGFHGGGAMSGGFHGGGSGWSGGAPRGSAWVGGGGFHGGGFQGGHGFHGGTRVFIGGGVGWWGWPGWWGAPYPYDPYPYYYGAPPVVVPQAPTAYLQQAPAPPEQTYWYYCQNAGAYYPYVKECPGGWMQVVPQPTAPGP